MSESLFLSRNRSSLAFALLPVLSILPGRNPRTTPSVRPPTPALSSQGQRPSSRGPQGSPTRVPGPAQSRPCGGRGAELTLPQSTFSTSTRIRMSSGMASAGWVSLSWMATCVTWATPSVLLNTRAELGSLSCLPAEPGHRAARGQWMVRHGLQVPAWSTGRGAGAGCQECCSPPWRTRVAGLSIEPATWLLCPTGPFTASQVRYPGTWRPRLRSHCPPGLA